MDDDSVCSVPFIPLDSSSYKRCVILELCFVEPSLFRLLLQPTIISTCSVQCSSCGSSANLVVRSENGIADYDIFLSSCVRARTVTVTVTVQLYSYR